ncbi:hypothetical protein CI102_10714 [Trichoderma harzianum]|nr:hypothetical protein CI102_10714 [Trichoderma harzianum]
MDEFPLSSTFLHLLFLLPFSSTRIDWTSIFIFSLFLASNCRDSRCSATALCFVLVDRQIWKGDLTRGFCGWTIPPLFRLTTD